MKGRKRITGLYYKPCEGKEMESRRGGREVDREDNADREAEEREREREK